MNKILLGLLLGAVLGAVDGLTSWFTPAVRAGLASSAALALIHGVPSYGLGNIRRYGATDALDFAVQFQTRFGPQILLTSEGAVTVSGAGAPVELARGGSAWVPAGSSTTLSGAGTVFRATPILTGSATGR